MKHLSRGVVNTHRFGDILMKTFCTRKLARVYKQPTARKVANFDDHYWQRAMDSIRAQAAQRDQQISAPAVPLTAHNIKHWGHLIQA